MTQAGQAFVMQVAEAVLMRRIHTVTAAMPAAFATAVVVLRMQVLTAAELLAVALASDLKA